MATTEIWTRDELQTNELVDDWLLSKQSKSTRKVYLTMFYKFLNHFAMTPEQLLKEAQEKKAETNKKGAKMLKKLNKWYEHLRDDLNKSRNYARTSENTIKSFLRFYEAPIKTEKRSAARQHYRKVLRKEDVSKLVEHTTNLRDKALIVMAFQSGMSISDLLALNYGDIKQALKEDVTVFMIKYTREKTETEAKTIIGMDCIELLTKYIEFRERNGETLTTKTALFVGEKNSQRLNPGVITRIMKKTALKAGLIDPDDQEYNTVGFHALRSGFASVSKLAQLPEVQIELALGHTLPYNGAYSLFTDDELIQNFLNIEKELSISEDAEQNQRMQNLENRIVELKDTIKKLEGRESELKDMVRDQVYDILLEMDGSALGTVSKDRTAKIRGKILDLKEKSK